MTKAITGTTIQAGEAADYRKQAREFLATGPALPRPVARCLMLKARTLGGVYRRGSRGMTQKEFQSVSREFKVICEVLAAAYGMTTYWWELAVVSVLQEIDERPISERAAEIEDYIDLACSHYSKADRLLLTS